MKKILVGLFLLVSFYTNAQEMLKDSLCSNTMVETDKFNGDIKYTSPRIDDIYFFKNVRNNHISQYVSILVFARTFVGYKTNGLTILFKSGKKIIRSQEIVEADISFDGDGYDYSVFFTPTVNEIKLLKTEEIEGVKLYIFKADVTKGLELKTYANCVLITPKTIPKKKK